MKTFWAAYFVCVVCATPIGCDNNEHQPREMKDGALHNTEAACLAEAALSAAYLQSQRGEEWLYGCRPITPKAMPRPQ